MLRKVALCTFLCIFIRFCEGAETPVFDDFKSSVFIEEGSPPGSLLIQVRATLQGAGVVTYSLDSVGQEWFTVNSTGHITVKKTLDREDSGISGGVLAFYVSASHGGEEAKKIIVCTIRDINDNPPVFEGTPYEVNVTEDAEVGTTVFTIVAEDADGRLNGYGEVVLKLVGGNEEDKFEINGGTGVVTIKNALDYETTKAYRLNITAADLKGNGTVTWTELVINIQDADDQLVNFTQGLYEATIDKESKPGTVFATVHAEDLDSHKAPVTYDIFGPSDPRGLFKIDSNTGACSLVQSLALGTYHFIVTARTTHHPPGFALVKLIVGLMFNTTYETSVLENEANVTIFDLLVLSGHFNMSGAQVSIAYGVPDGMFLVDPLTHAVKVGAKPLDREEATTRSLVMKVENNGNTEGYAKLKVYILDVNDNTPAFMEPVPYSVSTREDIDLETKIFVVQAFDGDNGANGTVTYSVSSGNEQGLFSLDNQTGVLSLAKSLDRETADRHVLTVVATDGGEPSRQNSTQLIIIVTDFNDNAPVLQQQILHVTVSENAIPGTIVAQVNATDADTSENRRLTYELLEGGDDKFVVDNTTGIIKIKSELDRETKDQYKMAIKVHDNGNTPQQLFTVGFVTVKILDVNDNSPVFQPKTYIAGVFKDSRYKHILVTVTATDADSQLNGDIVYELETGGEDGLFSVDRTGHVTSSVSLSDKEGTKHALNISAKDAGTPTRRSQVNAIVDIFVFREENEITLEAGVPPMNISKNNEEFLSVLGNLTGGTAFIKYLVPSGDSTLVKFFVVKDSEEMTSGAVLSALNSNQGLLESVHSKWKIKNFVKQREPSVGARTLEAGGLSAAVGALICLAAMIGVGGIVMIVILIRNRRGDHTRRRKSSSRVTFNDEPHYIDPIQDSSVSMAKEAHEEAINIPDDLSSSDGSESRYDYMNYAYSTDADDQINFSSFGLPPPPPGPPPPPPDDSDDEEGDEDEYEEPGFEDQEPGFEASDRDLGNSDESPGEESIADSVNSTANLVRGADVNVETTEL